MFLVLQKYKLLAKMLGLKSFDQNNILNRCNAICFVVLTFLLFLMTLEYSILNIHQVEKAINSIITFPGYIMTFTFISHFLINRDRFNLLENELQDIVNERNANHNM